MLALETQHFLTGEELTQSELLQLLQTAKQSKAERRGDSLNGKTLALIFDKPSFRTRASFTVGIQELGGTVLEVNGKERKSEDPEDSIRVLQGYVDGVMIRTFSHEILERMATHARVPIINGLSDLHHPCQALADLQTLQEKWGTLQGKTLAYVGDGNNVLHSLLLLLPYVGVSVHYACPEGFGPDAEILQRAHARAQKGGALIQSFATATAACEGVDAIYTDVWTSMGHESQADSRTPAFESYQLNATLYAKAKPKALIMHCMPVNKGQEITEEMMEHPQAALFVQSENRLHAQKALLMGLYARSNKRQNGISATT